jgi:hypothetical protein
MPVVPPELGVGTLERGVPVRLGLLDTTLPPCQSLYSFIERRAPWLVDKRWAPVRMRGGRRVMRTRSCGSWPTGYAETSSWILRIESARNNSCPSRLYTYWPWRRLCVSTVRMGVRGD